jgi:hypothetical protein
VTRQGTTLFATVCLPGRVLRRGEVIPSALLAFVADQIDVSPDAISGFARRLPTRYEHLAALKTSSGFLDLTRPTRARLEALLSDKIHRRQNRLS